MRYRTVRVNQLFLRSGVHPYYALFQLSLSSFIVFVLSFIQLLCHQISLESQACCFHWYSFLIGLCGTYDQNTDNDLLKPDGELYEGRGLRPDPFSMSWRWKAFMNVSLKLGVGKHILIARFAVDWFCRKIHCPESESGVLLKSTRFSRIVILSMCASSVQQLFMIFYHLWRQSTEPDYGVNVICRVAQSDSLYRGLCGSGSDATMAVTTFCDCPVTGDSLCRERLDLAPCTLADNKLSFWQGLTLVIFKRLLSTSLHFQCV